MRILLFKIALLLSWSNFLHSAQSFGDTPPENVKIEGYGDNIIASMTFNFPFAQSKIPAKLVKACAAETLDTFDFVIVDESASSFEPPKQMPTEPFFQSRRSRFHNYVFRSRDKVMLNGELVVVQYDILIPSKYLRGNVKLDIDQLKIAPLVSGFRDGKKYTSPSFSIVNFSQWAEMVPLYDRLEYRAKALSTCLSGDEVDGIEVLNLLNETVHIPSDSNVIFVKNNGEDKLKRTKWSISEDNDAFTNSKQLTAFLAPESIPYVTGFDPALMLYCRRNKIEVAVYFNTRLGWNSPQTATVQFDKNPPNSEGWALGTNGQSVFAREPNKFIDSIAGAKSLIIRTTTHLGTGKTLTFDLTGSDQATERVINACANSL
jgi:hypothetical protein